MTSMKIWSVCYEMIYTVS